MKLIDLTISLLFGVAFYTLPRSDTAWENWRDNFVGTISKLAGENCRHLQEAPKRRLIGFIDPGLFTFLTEQTYKLLKN